MKEEIKKILGTQGFEIFEVNISDSFGDYYAIYSYYDSIQLRFISSKSIESIDIRNFFFDKEWYDLALVKNLIYNESVLNKPINMNEYEQFLIDQFQQILILFNNERYSDTKKRLEDLSNKRVKQMFPYLKRK